MKLSYKLKVEDIGFTFSVYTGLGIKTLLVLDSMVGYRIGQFFFTKRIGRIHSRKH